HGARYDDSDCGGVRSSCDLRSSSRLSLCAYHVEFPLGRKSHNGHSFHLSPLWCRIRRIHPLGNDQATRSPPFRRWLALSVGQLVLLTSCGILLTSCGT